VKVSNGDVRSLGLSGAGEAVVTLNTVIFGKAQRESRPFTNLFSRTRASPSREAAAFTGSATG
jgi:hypothetical protein